MSSNTQVTVHPLNIIEFFMRMLKLKNSKVPVEDLEIKPEQKNINNNDNPILGIILGVIVIIFMGIIIYLTIKNKKTSPGYNNNGYYNRPYDYDRRRRGGLTFTF